MDMANLTTTPSYGSLNSTAVTTTSIARQPQRKLRIATIIDLVVPEGIRERRKAFEAACTIFEKNNTSFQHQIVKFDLIDAGDTSSLDAFYHADIAVIDFSIKYQRNSLGYHLGVRHSIREHNNLILFNFVGPNKGDDIEMFESMKITFGSCHFLTYTMVGNDVTAWDPSKIPAELFDQAPKSSLCVVLKDFLKKVYVASSTYTREKFLEDLRQARNVYNGDKLKDVIDHLKIRLDNPDVLSVDTLLQMLLSYKKLQEHESMCSLIEDLEQQLPNCVELRAPAIQSNYAWALSRRCHPGDSDKSVSIISDLLLSPANQTPEHFWMAAGMFKAKFVQSLYCDEAARDEAISLYRKGCAIQPSEYNGFSLGVLLLSKGHVGGKMLHDREIQQIVLIVNNLLGRKGSLRNIQDYWVMTSFFGLKVLSHDYKRACEAAECIYSLKFPLWPLKRCMEDIDLIQKFAILPQLSPEQHTYYQKFLFWTEFFIEEINPPLVDGSQPYSRFPAVLIEADKSIVPIYVGIHIEQKMICLDPSTGNVNSMSTMPGGSSRKKASASTPGSPSKSNTPKLGNSSQKSAFDVSSISYCFPAEMIKGVSSARKNDKAVFLYVHQNSQDFLIQFPTDLHRKRFLELTDKITDELPGFQMLDEYAEYRTCEYQFDYDSSGHLITLGRGTFGVVYSGIDIHTQRAIAIKEIQIKDQEGVQPLLEEINLQATLQHPNIVQYLGAEVDENQTCFRILMEAVPGGSLSNILRTKWGPLIDNEPAMAYYAKQILHGLAYLHSQRVVHRDIKGDNVLADIWSFGCTMIEMVTGKPPFIELGSPEEVIFAVGFFKRSPPIPKELSQLATDFILRAFEPDMDKRPSAESLKDDPFFSHYIRNDGLRKKSAYSKSKSTNQIKSSTTTEQSLNDDQSESEDIRDTVFIDGFPITPRDTKWTMSPRIHVPTSPRRDSSALLAIDSQDSSPTVSPKHLSGLSGRMKQAAATTTVVSTVDKVNLLHVKEQQNTQMYGSELSLVASPTPNLSDVFHDSKFFVLKKDSERRQTLVTILIENHDEIVKLWLELVEPNYVETGVITVKLLSKLLTGIEISIRDKNDTQVRRVVRELKEQLDFESVAVEGLRFAVFQFQEAVRPVLKNQRIKPHWMFALDNLIRSSIHSVVTAITPDLGPHLSTGELDVEFDNDYQPQHNNHNSFRIHSPSPEEVDSLGTSRREDDHGTPVKLNALFDHHKNIYLPLKEQVSQMHVENERLMQEYISLGESYQLLLSNMVKERRSGIAQLRSQQIANNNNNPIQSQSSVNGQLHQGDKELDDWLRQLDICNEAVNLIVVDQGYMLDDLLDYVTRDDLLNVGLRGGDAHKIWRAIVKYRTKDSSQNSQLTVNGTARTASVNQSHSRVQFDLLSTDEE